VIHGEWGCEVRKAPLRSEGFPEPRRIITWLLPERLVWRGVRLGTQLEYSWVTAPAAVLPAVSLLSPVRRAPQLVAWWSRARPAQELWKHNRKTFTTPKSLLM